MNRGRGAFSQVLRIELEWDGEPAGPPSVVAKLPVAGPNGLAAATSGAYRREALAYDRLLPHSPIPTPAIHLVDQPGDDTCALLLEDLTDHRAADQLDGLSPDDAVRVAEALTPFHRHWAGPERVAGLEVRRNTLAGLAPEALAAGLDALGTRWAEVVDDTGRELFAALVAGRDRLVERFDRAPVTLCHGDPRADNLVFDGQDRAVLFDWQQMAIQFPEADLAWLAATSLVPEVRRRAEDDLVAAAGGDRDRYRLGLALPGLTVLLLAQRDLPTERGRRFVAASLERIATALGDHEVPSLAR